MRSISTVILVLVCLFIFGDASAQCTDLLASDIWVGEFVSPHQTYDSMGFTSAVAEAGRLYLLQVQAGLVTVDISNPSTPEYVSMLPARVNTYDNRGGIAVTGDLVYLALGTLMVADISVPAAPDTAAVLVTRGLAQDVALVNGVLLVADGDAGLSTYDISAPITPAYLDSLILPGKTTRVISCEGRLFAATENPDAIHQIAVSPQGQVSLEGTVDLPGRLVDMDFADGRILASTWAGGLLWEVSVSGVFSQIRDFPEARGGAHLQGDSVWLGDGDYSEFGLVRYLIEAADGSDGFLGKTLGQGAPFRIIEHAGVVWAAELGDFWSGTETPNCQAFDPMVGSLPIPTTVYPWPNGTGSWSENAVLARVGDLVFNASQYGVQAVDIGDLNNASNSGYWFMPNLTEVVGAIGSVIVTHHVQIDYLNPRSWIQFWQVVDQGPVDLIWLSEVELPAYHSFGGQGDAVMVFGGRGSMSIVDVTDPAAPIVHGPFGDWPDEESTDVSGKKVIMGLEHSVCLIDISDPTAPFELGRWELGADFSQDVALDGLTSVVAVRSQFPDGDMRVIDWSNPAQPQERAVIPGYVYWVRLHQGLLVTEEALEARVYDMSQPSLPLELGRFPGVFNRTRRDGGWLLGLGSYSEDPLLIYPIPCGTVSSVPFVEDTVSNSEASVQLFLSPNPANPGTNVKFSLPARVEGTLSVYDQRGRLVQELRSGSLTGGAHDVFWDGRDAQGRSAASGVYLIRLTTETTTAVGKLTLVR